MSTSDPRLSEIALELRQPTGIVGSDFPRLSRMASRCGISFDIWQQGVLYLLLSKRADGKYACGAGGLTLSSCRQIGKTYTMGNAMVLLCVMRPGLKVIWTAHHSRTSDETFNDLARFEQHPLLGACIKHIRRANGQQEIQFVNGSRLMFGARERGFGRGLHSVDVEVFDEAQILTQSALDNMIAVVNTSPNPLVVFMGNPPKPGDQSEAFSEKRAAALAGTDGMAYIELSADPDCDIDDHTQWAKANPSYPRRTSEIAITRMRNLLAADGMAYIELSADPDCDIDDHTQWAKANPSYPRRTSEIAITRMRNLLAADSFKREALGIWDKTDTNHAIDPQQWSDSATPERRDGGAVSFAVDMPPDRGSLAIGACMRYPDGTAHIELAEYRDTNRHGIAWAVEWLASRWPRTCSIVIDAQSPATVLLPDLKARGVRVTLTNATDMGQACGRLVDMLRDGKLRHLQGQEALDIAVTGATKRNIGQSGAFGWNKRTADVDISPLVAVTLALHGASTGQEALDIAVTGATKRNIGQSGAFGWNKRTADVDISPLVAVTLALHGASTTHRNPLETRRVIRLP